MVSVGRRVMILLRMEFVLLRSSGKRLRFPGAVSVCRVLVSANREEFRKSGVNLSDRENSISCKRMAKVSVEGIAREVLSCTHCILYQHCEV